EIDRMMRDADSHAEDDKRKRESIEAKNRLDSLIYQTEKTIADNREKIPVATVSEVEAAVAEAKKAVESGDTAQINAQLDKLTHASHRIAEALYQQQASGGAGAGTAGGAGGETGQTATGAKASSAPGGDDVIDAEYIDVDENK